MRILGIETSCDETAAAVVEDGTKILSNVVASSVELHQKTGGIIPEVAAREQLKCIMPVIEEAIRNTRYEIRDKKYEIRKKQYVKNKRKKPISYLLSPITPNVSPITYHDIDAIAVTVGPGLIGSLLVGVETAKTLAYVWQKPIVPVNHLQAHLYANWLSSSPRPTPDPQLTTHPQFPSIGLVVSGGHTDLVLMKEHGKIKWLGGTRDDAAGECFDKTARLLGLPYPGGPAISAEAEKSKIENLKSKINLPRPMIEQENFDFSFSGLKTAVIKVIRDKQDAKREKSKLAAAIQQAIVDVLVAKTARAAKKYKVKSVLIAGGVAANKQLRERLTRKLSGYKAIKLYIPPPQFCTDNATYIASCAYFNYQPIPPPSVPPSLKLRRSKKPSARYSWQKIAANPGLAIESLVS